MWYSGPNVQEALPSLRYIAKWLEHEATAADDRTGDPIYFDVYASIFQLKALEKLAGLWVPSYEDDFGFHPGRPHDPSAQA